MGHFESLLTLAGVLIAAGFGGGACLALRSARWSADPQECPACAGTMYRSPDLRLAPPRGGVAYLCSDCRGTFVEDFAPPGFRPASPGELRASCPPDCVAA